MALPLGRTVLASAVPLVAAWAIGLGGSPEPSAVSPSPFDRPTWQVWPAAGTWSSRLEDEYAAFVARLGDAVASRSCRRLWPCLRDPAANLLWDGSDAALELPADCADLPYLLRAYFAFKRRLPFGFVSAVAGDPGRDVRYTRNLRPVEWRSFRDYATPRQLFRGLVGAVHTGMLRMAPDVEDADFYPVAVDRRAIRPGAVYYDPNGHAAVVARVTAEGSIYFLDGHPDGSLTWSRFGEALALGSAAQGGGFVAFRPLTLVDGALVRAPNRELPLFDAVAQHDRARWLVDGTPAGYHAWVRATLAGARRADPVQLLRDEVSALCRDVAERIEAVEAAVAAGLSARPHPMQLPDNIYGTEGEWEEYSTPSRDARLKAAVREIHRELSPALAALDDAGADRLRAALAAAWRDEVARPECDLFYLDTAGDPRDLSLDLVVDRLFELSFDPYHCPELRWGAPAGSDERAGCPDDLVKRLFYEREQRLRNRIDREYGAPTPFDSGPFERPAVDPRTLWRSSDPARALLDARKE